MLRQLHCEETALHPPHFKRKRIKNVLQFATVTCVFLSTGALSLHRKPLKTATLPPHSEAGTVSSGSDWQGGLVYMRSCFLRCLLSAAQHKCIMVVDTPPQRESMDEERQGGACRAQAHGGTLLRAPRPPGPQKLSDFFHNEDPHAEA